MAAGRRRASTPMSTPAASPARPTAGDPGSQPTGTAQQYRSSPDRLDQEELRATVLSAERVRAEDQSEQRQQVEREREQGDGSAHEALNQHLSAGAQPGQRDANREQR